MNRLLPLLSAVGLLALLVTTGCQTLSSSRFRSEATAVKLDGADAYQVSFTISEVAGDQTVLLDSPRLVFRAGQPANMRIDSGNRVINVEAYVQAGQANPLCLVKTRIHENGRQIFHHSEVVTPAGR
jgi:hypothetical protein